MNAENMPVTEEETAHLMKISNGRIVDLDFGPHWVSLKSSCTWAIEAIKQRRQVAAE